MWVILKFWIVLAGKEVYALHIFQGLNFLDIKLFDIDYCADISCNFFFLLVGILQIFLTFFYFSVYVKWMLTMIFFSCFLCECIYTFRVLYLLTNLDLISYKVYFFTLPIVLSFTFVVYLIIFFGVFHVSKWILYWNSLKSITAITTSSLRHLLSPIMPSSLSPYIRIQRCLVWQMCQNVLYMLYFSVSSTCFVIR